jgi:hypothetical protein
MEQLAQLVREVELLATAPYVPSLQVSEPRFGSIHD